MADHIEIAGMKVPLIDTVRPEDQTDMFPYVKQTRKTEVLPKGWQKASNKRPLPEAIVYDQHIEIPMRDGVKIYADVLRPHDTKEKVPALLAISPYGNGGNGFKIYENTPFRVGVPEEKTSGLEKFESVDPAEWIPRGYAIVNADVRGSWESEGHLYIEGSKPGIDGYDICEFIAAQDWCNGSIGMQGNSWLATTQWTTAVQKPPSLKAIAPWEGFTDKYREVCCRGGIPNVPFVSFIFNKTIRGRQKREDVARMLQTDPLMNPYWQDKNIDTTKITIPIYALASYSSAIHGFGTVKSYNNAASTEKWLRIHPTQEWYDLYTPAATEDLQKFFDRYLKGIQNGWEKMTPVRVSVLRFNQDPLINLPFSQYPPKDTEYRTLYLSDSSLSPSAPTKAGSISYQSDDMLAPPADFVHVFDRKTTLIGYAKATLWVSCASADDMDIYLSLRKADRDGKVLEQVNVPWEALPGGVRTTEAVPNSNVVKHFGPTGVLRLSHRAQDPVRSTPLIPFHPHDREEKVAPGSVTRVEIGFWPAGMQFESGERLVLRAQGFLDQCREFPQHISAKPDNLNKGRHVVHFGGELDSKLVVPVVEV
ncbi:hypothetical protein GTA08_BOTSDO13713 [Botryosphaeria dothidea]|uniref:Xaa-Pro dipeptidyl-peptidase C-terminal domain-containing protein n=1 Tax=Botryosphaeria dothidea TaxID=55169 RepID=A0A8H4J028_9PEZI|nr:hypothetical protein GTA08_BOTSDO13713 [Botryosphaeria dothidea]